MRICRALISEFRLREKQCPIVLAVIQSVLTQTKCIFLSNRAPITIFSWLDPANSLKHIVRLEILNHTNFDEISALHIAQADRLITTLEEIHPYVAIRCTKVREASVKLYNKKTDVHGVIFFQKMTT